MALELDVYESTIYKWEQGISNPNYLNTKKIIEFMGYDPRINNPLKIENYELTQKQSTGALNTIDGIEEKVLIIVFH